MLTSFVSVLTEGNFLLILVHIRVGVIVLNYTYIHESFVFRHWNILTKVIIEPIYR